MALYSIAAAVTVASTQCTYPRGAARLSWPRLLITQLDARQSTSGVQHKVHCLSSTGRRLINRTVMQPTVDDEAARRAASRQSQQTCCKQRWTLSV